MGKGGRGRLSSIDLLPEEADPIVSWAYQELRDRDRMQKDIHAEFNEKLAEIGLGPISASAFSRHSLGLSRLARRHEEVRQITSVLTERMEPGQTDDLTIIAAETIKTLIFELLHNDEGMTPKAAMELSRALQSAVNAQKVPLDRKRAQLAQFEKQVDGALEKVAEEAGMSQERKDMLKRDIFQLKK